MKWTPYCAVILAGLLAPVAGADAMQADLMATLGGRIYKDTNLSKNANQSCMTCHHPSAGFADPANRFDPVTFPVSEGSIPGLFGGRNAPSAAYTGFSPLFSYDPANQLYSGGMFWDGRATGATLQDPLAEQAQGPFLNPVEMALPSKEKVIKIIKKSAYANMFLRVFGPNAFDDVDKAYDNVGRAISAFEHSKMLNKFNSKFDKFWVEQGKDVSQFGVNTDFTYAGVPSTFQSQYFTRQEAEGLALFNAVNKGQCAACHLTTNHKTDTNKVYPPLFTDFTYDNLGIPVNPQIAELAGAQPIDYGLGAKTAQLAAVNPGVTSVPLPSGIPGVSDVQVVQSEAGKFKVPTLRNVLHSAPYGHNGYFATLEGITHFYNTRDDANAGWPKPEVDINVNKQELGNLGLSPEEEAAIVAFMRTLTDHNQ